jgi:hypothetical protein
VHEHIFAAIIANDEAEALLRIEEFYDALALADDLRGHSATAARPKAAARTAAAEATASTAAAEAAAVAEATAAAAAAKSTAITVAAAATKAAAFLETATKITCEILFAEAVALVATATTAVSFAPSIETHIRPNLISPPTPETNALGPNGATGHDA